MEQTKTKLKILVGCESSGTVRDAFIKLGHEAMSCDLLPTDVEGPHYQGDIRDVLDYPWDLAIFFPPCTHLSVSGARHFAEKQKDGRQQSAVSFFMMLAKCGIPRIAIENPVGIMSRLWRKPDQIIQPWQFGHPESKATCLWLINLPKLVPTNILEKQNRFWDNQCSNSSQNKLPPSPYRWKERSKTYSGVGSAMAEQWGV